MGEAASDLDDRARRWHAFSQAVRAAPRGSTEMLEAYYGLLASFEGDSGAAPRQLAIWAEALDVFPCDAQLLCASGSYLQTQNHLGLAARAFDAAVRFGQVNPETWHLRDVGEVAAACLSLNLQLLQRDDDARATLEEALGRRPDSIRLRRHLMDLHVKHGRTPEALRVAERLPMAAEDREPLRNAVRGAAWRPARSGFPRWATCRVRTWPAAVIPFASDGSAWPCCPTARRQRRLPVLHLWRQREPGNREVQAYLATVEPEASATPSRGTLSPMPLPQSQLASHRCRGGGLGRPGLPVPIVSQTFSTG